jgi:integrase
VISVTLASNAGYWRAEWRDPDGKKHSRGLGAKGDTDSEQQASRRAALKRCKEIELDLNTGVIASGKAPTLKAFLVHYRAARSLNKASAYTQDCRINNYLVQHFGESRRMDRVSLADAELWVAWIKTQRVRGKPLGDHSVEGIVRIARTIWNAAAKHHKGLVNPFLQISVQPMPAEVVVPDLAEADMLKIIDRCPTDGWKMLVGLCALAGLRRSEALNLTWGKIDFPRGRIRVYQPKTARKRKESERECWLCPNLSLLLASLKPAGALQSDRVCQGSFWPGNMHHDLVRAIEQAGFDPWPKPFHGLRKWRAVTWRQTELPGTRKLIPENYIDSWLGHGPEVARKHYVRVPESAYPQPV